MKLSFTQRLGTTILNKITENLDLAFVEFDSGWEFTDRLDSDVGEIIWSVAEESYWLEGAPIRKYGATSGKTEGTLLMVSMETSVDGYASGTQKFKDVFKVSNYTVGGDSGGTIGRQKTKQVFRLLGITFAASSDGSYGLGIKYSYINEEGITAYTHE